MRRTALAAALPLLLAACGDDPAAAAPPRERTCTPAPGAPAALLRLRCGSTCHELDVVDAATLDHDGWLATIDRMRRYGACLEDDELETLALLLAEP